MSYVEYSDTLSESELQNISSEFKRLKGEHYLDTAGAGLYAETQISEIHKELSNSLFLNPHTSKYTSDCVEQIRYRVLQHFNTNPNEYIVVFTSGTTAALKLAVECFAFSGNTKQDGVFAYLQDSHTSVLGLREIAAQKGAEIKCVPREQFINDKHNLNTTNDIGTSNLFVFPAQCNFSGYKYPLDKIEKIQNGDDQNSKWFVLLDAASFVATSFLDLSKWRPDFVAMSFYKIFGYPTGLGALLVKNSSAAILTDKKYFGGGTVEIAISGSRFHKLRSDISERLEDGTISFLSIISLRHGFDIIDRLIPANIDSGNTNSMERISIHVFRLARYLFYNLLHIRHSTGAPAVKLYSDSEYNNENEQGGIVNFNILKMDGSYVGFSEIEHMASIYNIHVRTGCFCNPGACQRHLQLTDEDLRNNHNLGHICGDENDLINGNPTGSVRVSFGYYSTKHDADAILNLIQTCYVITGRHENSNQTTQEITNTALEEVLGISKTIDITRKNEGFLNNEEYHKIKQIEIISSVNRQRQMNKLITNTESTSKSVSLVENKGLFNKEDPVNCLNITSSLNNTENVKVDTIVPEIDEEYSLNKTSNEKNTTKPFRKEISQFEDKSTRSLSKEEIMQKLILDDNDNCYETKLSAAFTQITDFVILESICVYPIKSCGAFKVSTEWAVGAKGFLYDREWMVVTSSGVALTQKQNSKLCLIKPSIDLDKQELTLSYPGRPSHSISLTQFADDSSAKDSRTVSLCRSKVCGDSVGGADCGAPVARWLSGALDTPGLRLMRQAEDDQRMSRKKTGDGDGSQTPRISLANQAQYLLVNKTSVQWLMQRSGDEDVTSSLDNYLDRFRANLVVRAPIPLEENSWTAVKIDDVVLKVEGPCARCQIICIDQHTGLKSSEPLRVIANEFHGKRTFGVYLSLRQKYAEYQTSVIKCGKVLRIRD